MHFAFFAFPTVRVRIKPCASNRPPHQTVLTAKVCVCVCVMVESGSSRAQPTFQFDCSGVRSLFEAWAEQQTAAHQTVQHHYSGIPNKVTLCFCPIFGTEKPLPADTPHTPRLEGSPKNRTFSICFQPIVVATVL
jgi:hypothetical protein